MSIIPTLLGGDLNAYSVALSFYNKYSVTSHAFMRYKCGATEASKFIRPHICSGLDDSLIAVPELLNFAKTHKSDELYLIPCSDTYVSVLESARDELAGIYNFHIPSRYHFNILSEKSRFYEYMEKRGISYPKTEVIKFGTDPRKFLDNFEYPIVIKPSNSSEYWKNPFTDMRKVYFVESKEKALSVINEIFLSGYRREVILQEKIEGAVDRVLTTFSDSRKRVTRAVYGEVILEECGKTSQGNHSAIVSLPLDDVSFRLVDFLNEIGYEGFANFDILVNKNGKYVLEINLRQGRSCDYLRGAGVNIAELLVENKKRGKILMDFSYKEFYWHYPKHIDVMRYSQNKWGVRRAEMLYEKGKSITPYDNKGEGLRRKIYVMIHNFRLSETIKRDTAKESGI